MSNSLLVSHSPHIHSGDTIEKNMYGVIIALIPALIASVVFFGVDALVLTVVSVVSCLAFEFLISRFMLGNKQLTITDGSALITGILLAMNLPSNLPIWIVIIGALVAIGLGKMVFGGLGNNIFNPAILGRVFLLVSFPQQMTTWPDPRILIKSGVEAVSSASIDAASSATPLAIVKGIAKGTEGFRAEQLSTAWDVFIGQMSGSMGEVSAIALLIGLVYLLAKRIISWHIPVSILVTAYLFAGIMHLANPTLYVDPLIHIVSGGMLLGAIFMATDYVTSPMTKSGQIIFGVSIGLITMLIRLFGAYPEGMSFAILIMNAFTPMLNRFTSPRLFGSRKPQTIG